MSVVCCQVAISASGCSPVQRSSTECGVFEGDCGVSKMRRSWPTWGCHFAKNNKKGVVWSLNARC